jgi:hypothetical protein
MTDENPEDESTLVSAGEKLVNTLVAQSEVNRVQAQRNKLWNRINSITVLLLVCVIAGMGFLLARTHADATALRNDSIVSCQSGNTFRSGQIEIWNKYFALQAAESKATNGLLVDLVDTLANNNPTEIRHIYSILGKSNAASEAEQRTFMNYVNQVNAPHDCTALYSDADPGGGS